MHAKANPRRLLSWAVLAVAGVGLAWLLWQWANDMAGVRREAPKVPAIIPLPPPPPPPPPEPPKEPEPPVEEKIVEPQPVPEAEEVKPAEAAPDPAQDLADPMQMDGDAQAGSDSFNVGAGKGGGMAGGGGGGLGSGTYSQYLAYAFQRLLRDNPELRNLVFNLQAEIWLSAAGEITRVELLRGSGEPEVDAQVLAALRAARALDQRPPASLTLPVKIALQGRRP
ncbi:MULTISPECIES: TonB family protein [unclassified Pseudomonas]|uniref:TonB family protein n=1 Tax=unclassified Pseudomonas TaxID=196821 RepID=UPI002096EFDC|nr:MULTISPECIES: TonB family protein [unclassified Pseudomonas]MCO7519735.1 TonB family protein [Pseudomonas sp. 1]MCO7540197.1 TonB family protein [Pseudomonas sp. VA159-2]